MKKTMLVLLLTISMAVTGCSGDDEVEEQEEVVEVEMDELEETEEAEEEEEEVIEEVEETEEVEASQEESGSAWDDMKENIVGVSDKDFGEITNDEPTDVAGDTTGRWKKLVISEGVAMEEYAKSYYDKHMSEDDVHFVIDFGTNTTTSIKKLSGLIFVDIFEYVNNEEHDANTLGTGMLLQSYTIYPDGDIQKVDVSY